MKTLSLPNVLARSSALMAARLVGGGIAFGTNLLIARHFGAETLGIIALTMAFVSLLALGVSLGRPAVGMMFVSAYLEHKKLKDIRGFIVAGYRTIAFMSVIVTAAFAALLPFADRFVHSDRILAVALACLMAPAFAIINFNSGVLTGYRRQLLALVPDLVVKPALILIAVLAFSQATPVTSPHVLLAGFCLALWLTAGFQALLIRRQRIFPHGRADTEDAGRWRKKAAPWIVIILLSDYVVELHLLAAGLIAGPAEVAILHVCFRLRMLASFGMRALYSFVMPDFYAAHAGGDRARTGHSLTRGNALALGYTLGVCASMAVLGSWLLGLFGEDFTAAYWTLIIVVLTMIPRAVFGPATAVMAAAGEQCSMIIVLILGIAVSMLVCVATFQTLGVNSIALGYAVSITFVSVAQWWQTLRETGVDCSIFSAFTMRRNAPDETAPATGLNL